MSSLILLFSLLVPVAGAVSAQPEELRMWMTVGERRFAVTLTDNAAARAFAAQLLVVFYLTFQSSYSYTRLGRVDDPSDLPRALGPSGVRVVFSKD